MPPWATTSPITIAPTVTASRPELSTPGLTHSTAEFVAIFDADFTPPPEWVQKVIHHFADPAIGMVQTRWTHLNRSYSISSPN